MRIALITLHTPSETNCGGASALPWHLLANRPEGVDVEVWSMNQNHISEADSEEYARRGGYRLHFVKRDDVRLARALRLRAVRSLPPMCALDLDAESERAIREGNFDGVWIYGEELSHIGRRFADKRVVMTGPDCEALYYERLLAMPQSFLMRLRYWLAGSKYRCLAKSHPKGLICHVVGEADRECLQRMRSDLDVRFVRHPHYEFRARKQDVFSEERIKLLIAGRNDIYMGELTTEACRSLAASPELAERYRVTFLGKGWESVAEELRNAGFDVEVLTWVDDYIGEIQRHDIQLTAISVGTGTKGKVLDALANGLLVIGTERALENIAVRDGESCEEYSDIDKLIDVLREIPVQRDRYRGIAQRGQENVLNEHGARKIAKEFFEMFD